MEQIENTIPTNNQVTPTTPAPSIAPQVVSQIPAPTAQSVYGAQNIAQAATSPALPVNRALEEYNAFLNTPEISTARQNVSQIQQALNAERSGLRGTTTGLEYQNDQALGSTGASANLIGRQVGRANQLSSNRQMALGEQLSAANAYLQGLENTRREQFNVYTQEKQRIQALIAQTGNKAGISPSDSFEVATEKAYKWQQSEKKKQEKKLQEESDKKEKEALKSSILKLGGSTKTKLGGSLDIKGLRKEYERLSGEAYKKEQSRSDQEWSMKVAQFNKSMASGNSDDEKEYAKIKANLDKDVDSWKEKMNTGKANWADAFISIQRTYGLDTEDIDALLGLNYRDKYDKELN